MELDTRDEQFDSYVTHLEMAPDCLFIQQPGDDSETEDVSIENGMEVETNLVSEIDNVNFMDFIFIFGNKIAMYLK